MLWAGTRDLVPLYAVYALLFRGEGLSDAAISGLFALWSLVAFVAEVPTGAIGDVLPRRLVLAAGSLLTAGGFALWVAVPTTAGFAAGFVLWGIGGALQSGTWESLLYDALVERRAPHRYAGIVGAGEATGWVATVLSAAAAAPLTTIGGYGLVGWASAGIAAAHAGLALLLPEPPRTGIDPDEAEDGAEAGPVPGQAAAVPGQGLHPVAPAGTDEGGPVRAYVTALREGLREATGHPPVRRSVLLLAALTGLLAFDEYLPLVAVGAGAAEADVPWLMAVTSAVAAVAALLAGRAEGLPARWTGVLLATGAVLVAGGALAGSVWGYGAVALGYAVLSCTLIVADARLQASIEGPSRSTVTSTAGLGSELVAVLLFAAYAGGSVGLPIGVLLALNALPLLLLARPLGRAEPS